MRYVKYRYRPDWVNITTWTVIFAIIIGYYLNVYKLFAHNDFASPYKTEVSRIVGIVIPPVGAVLGYINIED
jgi:hypothetical protein